MTQRSYGLLAAVLVFVPPFAVPAADLDKSAPVRLDRNGDPLPAGAVARLGSARWRHLGVYQVLFSPDGRTLYSSGGDHTIRRWDVATGKELGRAWGVQEGWGGALALSPDGKLLASNGRSHDAYLFNASTLRVVRHLHAISGVSGLAFSPDGRHLAAGCGLLGINRWDVATGRRIGPNLSGTANRITYSADGKTLRAADFWWDVATGKRIDWWPEGTRATAPSADGRLLATGHADHTVRLWDAATRKELRCLTGHKGLVGGLAFSRDGKLLVTCCHYPWPAEKQDTTIRVWDVASGKLVRLLHGHEGWVGRMTFAPSGRVLASSGADGRIILWDIATGKEVHAQEGRDTRIARVSFSPTGKVIATAGDGSLRLWEAPSGRPLRRFAEPACLTALAWAPDGRTLAGGHAGGGVRIWDPVSGKERRRLGEKGEVVQSLAFSPDGRRLAAIADGILLWSQGSEEAIRLGSRQDYLHCLALTPDGKRLFTNKGNTLVFRDATMGKSLREVELEYPSSTSSVWAMVFAPDGRALAVVSGNTGGRVSLRDARTGGRVLDLDTTYLLGTVAFSPDGRMLATGTANISYDSVLLWEVATGKLRHQFRANPGWVLSLSFSHDGRLLASAHEDGLGLIWDLFAEQGEARPLRAERLRQLWKDLESEDATRAYAAVRKMAGSSASAPFLRERLLAIPSLRSPTWRLVAKLDSRRFAVRERAVRELERLGRLAEPALRRALAGQPSLEARRRVETILEVIEREGPTAPVPLLRLRALEALEHSGTREARGVLQELAQGPRGTWLALQAKDCLARLVGRGAKK